MKKARLPKPPGRLADWEPLAEKKLRSILRKARSLPGLGKLGEFGHAPKWNAEVRVIGAPAMARLNARVRGKPYATDVLSFPVPEIFQRQGELGELVVCLPVLLKQARELGHRPEVELQVLLVHGVLHLLGLDHEKGPKAAREMARWEAELLPARSPGLIRR
jgi:probable rRNA maturation factor